MRLLATLLMLVIFTAPSLADNNGGAAFSTWPDTGQEKCYNANTEIPCPAPVNLFMVKMLSTMALVAPTHCLTVVRLSGITSPV